MSEHEQIRDILLNHKGKENAITAETIAEQKKSGKLTLNAWKHLLS